MPVVGWLPHAIRDERGRWLADSDRHHIVFENGRHRTAWVRDHGATAMPVLAYYSVTDIIAAELGTTLSRWQRIDPDRRAVRDARRQAKDIGALPAHAAGCLDRNTDLTSRQGAGRRWRGP
jgi:hypothetical protein